MTTSTSPDIECKPLKLLHTIGRREFVKDTLGNYVLVNGEKVVNYRCVCGRLSAQQADYKGGEYVFVYSDEDAAKYGVGAGDTAKHEAKHDLPRKASQ